MGHASGADTSPFAGNGFGGACVSRLGLGTVKLGRNRGVKYPEGEGFALPTDREIEVILDLALECGITLIDTAPAYGTAEERLGRLMGSRRERFFLVTKVGEEFADGQSIYDFSEAHVRMSVERSLRRLRTGFLDCVLIHASRDDENVLAHTPALETLLRLKDEGKIGQVGASTHTVEGGCRAADLSDCVMVAYHKDYTEQRPVIENARRAGKAVLIKKGFNSGHVGGKNALAENMRFVINTPGVTSLVFGSIDPDHIRTNAEALIARERASEHHR
jgi:aryl-alcohol dehydrogenase-like predicted oxidoreductase